MAAFNYSFKSASRIKADAQKTGELCEQLESTVGLTAKTLLNASRKPTDLLYSEFEWDNEIAAENYREGQARNILNSLIIMPSEDIEDIPTPTRAFHCIKEDCTKTYKSLQTIIKRPDLAEQLLQQACKDLESFETKYKSLKDILSLKHIYNEIEDFNRRKGE